MQEKSSMPEKNPDDLKLIWANLKMYPVPRAADAQRPHIHVPASDPAHCAVESRLPWLGELSSPRQLLSEASSCCLASSKTAMDKFFRSSELSDIDIIYTVQQHQPQPLSAARRSKRAKTQNAATCFPGHKLCLSSHSSVMRTEVSEDMSLADGSCCNSSTP
jgi:hypothetical protein